MTRTNKIILIIGKRGTGKTDYIKEIIDVFPQPKKLIVDTLDNPPWRNMKTWKHPDWSTRQIPVMPVEKLSQHENGLYRMYSEDTDLLQEAVAKHCEDTLVVMEDATRYFNSKLSKAQKAYLLNSKQKNVDVIIVWHYLGNLPAEILRIADYIVLFKTGEGAFNPDKYFHPGFKEAFEYVKNSKNKFEYLEIDIQ